MSIQFRVGDKVEAITEFYGFTTHSEGWTGVVTRVSSDGSKFDAKTLTGTHSYAGEEYEVLMSEHFRLIKIPIEREAEEL